jgi:hypothetical protein
MMLYDGIWCYMMLYDSIWCYMMLYDSIWCYIIYYIIRYWILMFMVTWYWLENSISHECNGIRSIAFFASAIVLYVLFHCTLCVFDKSHPSKCFSYESISLFWYYIKQIIRDVAKSSPLGGCRIVFTWFKKNI